MTTGHRGPGERGRIVLITNDDEFSREFPRFLADTDSSRFPFVGANMKWNLTMATAKQRNKTAKKKALQNSRLNAVELINGFQSSHHNRPTEQQLAENDPTYYLRQRKSTWANIALLTLSNINGYTLQIRTCLFEAFPEELKTFLETDTYWKIGFGLRKDMYKLWEEEKCHLLWFLDLRYVLMDWKEFRSTYHFRRLGTYSVASHVFDRNFQNTGAAVFASDWYAYTLKAEQIYATANQTQLDVDLFAHVMMKRLNLTDSSLLTEKENMARLNEMINHRKNAAWEPSKYNFAEMPMVRQAFDNSERKFLPETGDWVRCRFTGEAAADLYRAFNAQPYLGVNAEIFENLVGNDMANFLSTDERYVLKVEILEVNDLDRPSTTAAAAATTITTTTNDGEHQLQQSSASSSSTSDRTFLSNGNRRRSGRPSYEKALSRLSNAATSSGPDAATVATARRLKLLAKVSKDDKAADSDLDDNNNIDDSTGSQGEIHMDDLGLSDVEDSLEDNDRKESRRLTDNPTTSTGPTYWLPPIVGDQFAEYDLFNYDQPKFKPPNQIQSPFVSVAAAAVTTSNRFPVSQQPQQAATLQPRSVRLSVSNMCSSSPLSSPPPLSAADMKMPPRMAGVPMPFVNKLGQPIASPMPMPRSSTICRVVSPPRRSEFDPRNVSSTVYRSSISVVNTTGPQYRSTVPYIDMDTNNGGGYCYSNNNGHYNNRCNNQVNDGEGRYFHQTVNSGSREMTIIPNYSPRPVIPQHYGAATAFTVIEPSLPMGHKNNPLDSDLFTKGRGKLLSNMRNH